MSHLETLVQRMTNASALDEDSEICEKKNRTSSPIRISRLFGSTDAGIKSAATIRFDLNQHHQVCDSLISGMLR